MSLQPSELEARGFTLLDSLKNEDITAFVKLYLNKRTRAAKLLPAINMLIIFAISAVLIYGIRYGEVTLSSGLLRTISGFSLAFLLIPLHEYIHILAFKRLGAVQTSYEVNLRKFYFLAVAHHFVADRKSFRIAALAPFIVISVLLIIALFLVTTPLKLTLLGTLLLHTVFCSGDFGLLSYFEFHQDKEVVTYDDKDEKKIYFFSKPL